MRWVPFDRVMGERPFRSIPLPDPIAWAAAGLRQARAKPAEPDARRATLAGRQTAAALLRLFSPTFSLTPICI